MEPLPKPVKQALEDLRKSAGPHPDTDLLAAFQEGAVTVRERERLLAHFAACAHCREVARLSLPAPESKQQVVVPVASGWRRWVNWAAVATTAVVLGSVGIIYQAQHHGSEQARLSATRSDTNAPVVDSLAPAAPAPADNLPAKQAQKTAPLSDKAKAAAMPPEAPTVTSPPFQQAAPLRQKATVSSSSSAATGKKAPDFLAGGSQAGAQAASPSTADRGPQRPPLSGVTGATQSGANHEVGSRAQSAPPASGPNQSDSLAARSQALKAMGTASEAQRQTSNLPHSPSALDSAATPRPRWRISPAGELQRAIAGNDWQTVLASAHAQFHAVTVVGNDVWAGGSEASLFHSADGGASWSRVALPTNRPATPTITRIAFDDALHGTVGADNAATWTTADGGRTWSQR
jgi:hypothetical protein